MKKNYFHSRIKRNFNIGMIWVNGGSSMDSIGKKGVNNILGSLLTRGCKGFDNLALSDLFESYGAELNQEVLEDGFLISLKSLDVHFKKLFPFLELIINEPTLPESQFHIVKKLTLNALKKDKENPFMITFEKWRKIVYLEHPYAFNNSGYENDVLNLQLEDVLSEYKSFKNREKFIITNDIKTQDNSLKVSNKKFFKEDVIKNNVEQNHDKRFTCSYNKSNQVIIFLGNQTCSRLSIEHLPLKLLESYLSFGMSSALFKYFREKHGMTYEVGVFNPIRRENAPFLVYLSVSKENAVIAFELLCKLWQELLNTLIPLKELDLAKKKLKSSFLFGNQSLDEILHRKIQLISYGMYPCMDEHYFKHIQGISPKDIKNLTSKYFSQPYLSISGEETICNEIYKKWKKVFN